MSTNRFHIQAILECPPNWTGNNVCAFVTRQVLSTSSEQASLLVIAADTSHGGWRFFDNSGCQWTPKGAGFADLQIEENRKLHAEIERLRSERESVEQLAVEHPSVLPSDSLSSADRERLAEFEAATRELREAWRATPDIDEDRESAAVRRLFMLIETNAVK